MRIGQGLSEYPLRIVISGSASISPDAEVFKSRVSPIVILVSEQASSENIDRLKAVADEVIVCGGIKSTGQKRCPG